MAYKPTIQEMAEDLPDGAAECSGMKAQMLLVAEIMRLFTDETHGLTADEMRRVIGEKTGRTPTAAKVRDDIHTLASAKAFGMDVSIPSRGENAGFRCRKTFLSSEQARLAINMVRTCKFVTQKQRDDICEALFEMVSYYQQDDIARSVVVDERELPQSPEVDVFSAAEAFSSALEMGKMISFKYAARGLDGKEKLARNPLDGSCVLEETPVALVFSFGNYYAETWFGDANDGRRMTRRLDRMRETMITDTPSVSSPVIERLRSTVQQRIGQTFDMFGEGKTRDLFLKVNAWSARYIYDRFGHGVKFEHVANDGSCGYIHIQVKPAQTFYRWLFGMGNQITLAKPKGTIWEDAFWGDSPETRKTHDALVHDYEYALKGMKKQLLESAAAYGMSLDDSDMASLRSKSSRIAAAADGAASVTAT